MLKKIVRIFIIGVFSCFVAVSARGATITGGPPIITFDSIGVLPAAAVDQINATLAASLTTTFNLALSDANAQLAKYTNQNDLAKGFANANAYAAQAATLQGYQDYSLFAVAGGIMVGAQAPSIDPGYYQDIDTKLETEGDIYAGVGAGLAFVNLGYHAKDLYPGLYFNLKFGKFSRDIDQVEYKTTHFGFGVNYSLYRTKKYSHGIVKWRGISIGTGFIYNKSQIDLEVELDPIIQPVPTFDLTPYGISSELTGMSIVLDPSFLTGVHAKTYTIPFDITSSVRLLWFLNFNLGAGIDLNFGSSDIILEANGSSSIVATGISIPFNNPLPGVLIIDGSTKNTKPSLVRARVTTGLGINILPVKIDVPIIWYLKSGFAAGVTVGIVW